MAALPDFTTPDDLAQHIGVSSRRVRELARGDFSVLLMIPGTVDLERYFHTQFAGQRIVREWFKLDGPIEEFIARRKFRTRPGAGTTQ